MSRSKNTIKFSDISTAPVKLRYSTTYSDSDFDDVGISIVRGINTPVSIGEKIPQFKINYKLIEQLFYKNYISGSLLGSGSAYDSSYQSTAASGSLDEDIRYFPTESNAEIVAFYIPRNVFGEQIARKSFLLNTSRYTIYDDGNGNLIDEDANVKVGNIIYSQAFAIITNPSYLCYFVRTDNWDFEIDQDSSPIIVPSNTPTSTITPSNTPSNTVTPTTSKTPGMTDTQTPTNTITPSNTATPSKTPSNTATPSNTVTPSKTVTPSNTATPSNTVTPSETNLLVPSGTELKVRGKYVNSNGDLQYQINTGGQTNIGALQNYCANVVNIGPLNVGDTVTFSDVNSKTIAGDPSTCPESGFGCTYQVTIVSGTNWAYITLDGSLTC